MKLSVSLQTALRSMMTNKLRSALTMLGIVIGVGAVIALVAAGAGAKAQVTDRFQSLGSNLLVISPAKMMFRGIGMGSSSSGDVLTNDDVAALRAQAPSVLAVAPEYSTYGQIVFRSKNTQTQIYGVSPEYLSVRNWEIDRGRFVDDLDISSQARVVVLGASVVEDLFGGTTIDPLGKDIRINRQIYTIAGILASKGAGSFQNLDDAVFIPLTTAQIKFGGAGTRSVNSINVQAVSADKMDRAQAEVTSLLRARHGISGAQTNDFMVQNQTQLVESMAETAQTFSILLGSIASISLVVGGIGIMNIMLVSVTERTREIGIRKAVGARKRDILAQFLVEAIALSLLGGLIGVGVGVAGAKVVTPLLGATRAVVTSESVALALGVSVAVGLFFGIYPAARAAGLNPMEALRYE